MEGLEERGHCGHRGGENTWECGQRTPVRGISPRCTPYLRAAAARLAGRQVLAEFSAQVCATEPGAGGAAGPEFKGRCAAVLWGQGQAGRLVGDTLHPPKPRAHNAWSHRAPRSHLVRVQDCPLLHVRQTTVTHPAPRPSVPPGKGQDGWALESLEAAGRKGLWGLRGLAGAPGVGR